MKHIVVFSLVFCTLFTGCATIISGKKTEVNVTSSPSQATCNYDGQEIITPGVLMVNKQKDTTVISCVKAGYRSNTGMIKSSFNTFTLLNLLTGPVAVIGIPTDLITGAIWEQNNYIKVTLLPY